MKKIITEEWRSWMDYLGAITERINELKTYHKWNSSSKNQKQK